MADTAERPGIVERGRARWRRLKDERPSVRHLVAAWGRVNDTNGNQYAAAITFFSFLALFPLLLLAVAVAGFVLRSNPDTLRELFNRITTTVPGGAGKTLRDSIQTAIDARTGVGIVGLIGVLLTGLGWIGNLRRALDAVWQVRPPAQNLVAQRVSSLGVLAGLGIGALISVSLTAGGTALTGVVVRFLHLDGISGMSTLVVVAGVLLALAGDVVIFSWVLIRLPHAHVAKHIGIRGAVLAAVGFEVLKIVGTFTIAATSSSPTAGPFAGLLAVLVWIQLVARLLIFCVAWTVILTEAEAEPMRAMPYLPGPADRELAPVSPLAVGATLVGAGALVGAAAAAMALSGRPRSPAFRAGWRLLAGARPGLGPPRTSDRATSRR
ncbi:MAG: YihY/virulence factor BrkB family protein [Actinomycetota bacterium]|nr:YihY/virulence factor BrkB family protein [Actinomycetota bacterium]